MRKNRRRNDIAMVVVCAAIIAGCFAAMLTLGGCAEPSEEPIPQENPTEELWSERLGEISSALELEAEAAGAPAAGGYDRGRALWYIERYARDPNTRFDYCGDWTLEGNRPVKIGADCTNFASQVLWYGGLKTRRGGAGDPGWWSEGGCRAWNSSDSWRQVYPLIHELLSVSRRGEVVQDVRLLKVGDVIFYRLRDEAKGYACPQVGSYNHTAVVSGFGDDGEPLVSYHSNDAMHVPWDAHNGSYGALGEACGVLLVHIKD